MDCQKNPGLSTNIIYTIIRPDLLGFEVGNTQSRQLHQGFEPGVSVE